MDNSLSGNYIRMENTGGSPEYHGAIDESTQLDVCQPPVLHHREY